MAWLLVRLKLQLLKNTYRGWSTRAQFAIVSAMFAVALGAGGGLLLAVGGRSDTAALVAAVGVLAALNVGWLMLPLVAFGSDETLDLTRLTLLPLPKRPLMLGLLGAAAVGAPGLGTLIALLGAVVGYARSPIGAVLVLVDIVVFFAICLSTVRLLTTWLGARLQSRRSREVAAAAGALLSASVYFLQFPLRALAEPGRLTDELPGWVGLTPAGMAAGTLLDIRSGRYGVATARLLGLTLLATSILVAWASAIDRSLTTSAASDRSVVEPWRGRPAPALLARILPTSWAGLVAARELRYVARDPRRLSQLATMLPISMMPVVLLATGPGAGVPRTAVFSVCYLAVLAASMAGNVFGVAGPAWWLHLSIGGTARGDLIGSNLAWTVVLLPLQALVALALGALTGAWGDVPAALGLAAAAHLLALGTNNITTVLAPVAVSQGSNQWAAGSGGGCLSALYQLAGMAAIAVALTPSVVLIVMAEGPGPHHVAAVVIALLTGAIGWWYATDFAARRADRTAPELLAVISPRELA